MSISFVTVRGKHPVSMQKEAVMIKKAQAATSAVGWQVDDCHYLQYHGAQLIPNNKDPSKIKSVLERLFNKPNSKSCTFNCKQGKNFG